MATPRHPDDDVLAEVITHLLDQGDEAMVAKLITADLRDLFNLSEKDLHEIAARVTAQMIEEG